MTLTEELAPLLARPWLLVGVGSDLPKAGDQRPVNLMGWPLLIV